MASGRPVIAYKKGGALETVIEGETGLFFEEQSVASLKSCVQKFCTESKNIWDSNKIREHSKNFSLNNFKERIDNFLKSINKYN